MASTNACIGKQNSYLVLSKHKELSVQWDTSILESTHNYLFDTNRRKIHVNS